MTRCFFISDLHGRIERYDKLFGIILMERPDIVLLGGDLLPHGIRFASSQHSEQPEFIDGFLAPRLERLKSRLSEDYPRILVILGNDDPRNFEPDFITLQDTGLIEYVHNRRITLGMFEIYGYSCVPPTPFMLKDWERYDVSRYVNPGCISPEEGVKSVHTPEWERRLCTIKDDLNKLTQNADLTNAVFLFHSPPYQTKLDHAVLDGRLVDHVPLDDHVGSISIRRLIEARQPLLTLHGHIHESTRLTGDWRDRIGRTWCFNAAYDGSELSLIRFSLEKPEEASRELIRT